MINPKADFPRKFLRKWSSQRDKYYQMQGLIGPRAEPSTRNAISAAAALSYDAVLVLEAAFNSLMQVSLLEVENHVRFSMFYEMSKIKRGYKLKGRLCSTMLGLF